MTPQEDTPLVEMLQMGLEKYLEELTEISSQASKEYAMEKVNKLHNLQAAQICLALVKPATQFIIAPFIQNKTCYH